MKKASLTIIFIGLVITAITGFSFITREEVMNIGSINITRKASHGLNWSPAIGFGIMIIGAVLYFYQPKK